MGAFEPVGDRARWRIIYEVLSQRAVGEVMSYDEMGELLDLDPVKDRNAIRSAWGRAAHELLVVDKHATVAVPNEGYRIVEAEGHVSLAHRDQRRSTRALMRGRMKVTNVDYNEMSPALRRVAEVTAAAFSAQMDFNRRLDTRQANLEKAMASLQQSTTEDAAEVRARLDRLEEKLSESA